VLAALFNRQEHDRALWVYGVSLKYYLVATVPCAAALTAADNALLTWLTTPEYTAIAEVAMPLIAWGAVCYGVAIVARSLLGVAHKHMQTMYATGIATAGKLVLLVVLILWLEVLGAGIATFLGFFALMVTFLVMARPVIAAHQADGQKLPVSPASLTGILVAALAAGVPLHLIAHPSGLSLLAGFAVYGVLYLGALFALRVLRVSEVRTLWQMVTSHKRRSRQVAEEETLTAADVE
jgi:O-antigen/teichoic acid export membrane protein